MKAVMKFQDSAGERTVTFDTSAHLFSSSDGRSGLYTRNGTTMTMNVEGQSVPVALAKDLTSVGDTTTYTSPMGEGVATLISAS